MLLQAQRKQSRRRRTDAKRKLEKLEGGRIINEPNEDIHKSDIKRRKIKLKNS